MGPACAIRIKVQPEAYDTAAEIAVAKAAGGQVGAVVSFSGVCRDESGRLAALELEHYPGMAEAQIGRIAAEAARRWPVGSITVIHRYGKLRPGDDIVLVVASSTHRDAAFETASFLMDYLKTSAPFWKKEHLVDGTDGGWVAARQSDDEAAARW